MNWRKMNYTTADGVRLVMDIESVNDYKTDVEYANGYCKKHGLHFVRLGKSLYDTFGNKIKSTF